MKLKVATRLIITICAALALVGAALMPTSTVAADVCGVSDVDVSGVIYPSSRAPFHHFDFQWQAVGGQTYTIDKSTDAGANWTTVKTTTGDSEDVDGGAITAGLRYRLSVVGCGEVVVYDPPSPPYLTYISQDIL